MLCSFILSDFHIECERSERETLCIISRQLSAPTCCQVFVFLWVTTLRDPDLRRAESEKTFLDPKDGKRKPFPSITDAPSVYLSLVVPAYKEEKRCEFTEQGQLSFLSLQNFTTVPKMMSETMEYLEKRKVGHPSSLFFFFSSSSSSSPSLPSPSLPLLLPCTHQ